MKVRQLNIDFSNSPTHWAPNPEFAQQRNATSMIPVHVEPYLVKVMIKAREALGPGHAKLKDEIGIFIKQETQHYKQHQRFNDKLYAAGYDELPQLEKELADDYKRFLATKSLKFNLAYSEGFETLGPANLLAMFRNYDGLLDGADQTVVDLWKWHMVEEYEHRSTVHDTYHALYGRNFFTWLYRLYGLWTAVRHLGSWGNGAAAYMLAKDREKMNAQELAASQARAREGKRKFGRLLLPYLLRALSPFYHPSRIAPPPGLEDYIARVEAQYGKAA
jgi:uncharacterized protein